jgi:hypothetical protein
MSKAVRGTLPCIDCDIDTLATGQYYIVLKHVGAESGLEPQGGILCLDCLEKRIGRQLTTRDFGMLPSCWRKRQMGVRQRG